jgi:hypothetical protein
MTAFVHNGKEVEFSAPCFDKKQIANLVSILMKAPKLEQVLDGASQITLTISTKVPADGGQGPGAPSPEAPAP